MTDPGRPTLLFYRRDGCHLCDDARETLQAVLEERAATSRPVPAVREVDIEADPAAGRDYVATIPVLALNGHELPLATSVTQIREFLERALSRSLA